MEVWKRHKNVFYILQILLQDLKNEVLRFFYETFDLYKFGLKYILWHKVEILIMGLLALIYAYYIIALQSRKHHSDTAASRLLLLMSVEYRLA